MRCKLQLRRGRFKSGLRDTQTLAVEQSTHSAKKHPSELGPFRDKPCAEGGRASWKRAG